MDKTTDQLLNLLEAEIDTTDSEPKYCIIDPDRREIYVDPDYQILGVESDEKADRILFRCPKTVGDGLDLTQYQLRINYQNANDQKGQYLVEDVTVDGEDILFSWLLHRPVTAYQGTVRFIVCAISVEEGEVKNEWNTTVAQCDVLEGLEVENPVIPAPEEDLIAQLIQQMQDKVEQAQQALEAIESAKTSVESTKAEIDKTKGEIDVVKEEVNTAKQDVDTTKQEISKIKTSVEATKTAVDSVKESVEATKTEVESAKSSVDASVTTVNETKSQIDTIKTQIDTTKTQIDTKAEEVATSAQQASDAKDQAETAKAAAETASQQASQSATSAQEALSNMQELAETVEEKVDSLSKYSEETIGLYYNMQRDGRVYQTRFYKFETNPTSEGTKMLANANLVCEPSTSTEQGQDDYANIPLFQWVHCNYKREADGTPYPVAIEGDENYKTTGDVDVGSMMMSFWYKVEENGDYIDYYISDSPNVLLGLKPWTNCVRADGTTVPWNIYSSYFSGLASDGKLRSQPNLRPENFQSYQNMVTNYGKKGDGYFGAGVDLETFQILMIAIKYGTKNSQPVFKGTTNYNVQYQAAVQRSEKDTYFPVTQAQKNNIIVGSSVYVGYPSDNNGTPNYDRGVTTMREYANMAKVLRIEDDGDNARVYLDCDPFDTMPKTVGTISAQVTISSMHWYSGTTDKVIGHHDGSEVNSDKYPYRVQGIEYAVGGYLLASDTIMDIQADMSKIVYKLNKGAERSSSIETIKANSTVIGTIPAADGSNDYWIGDIGIKDGAWYPKSKGTGNTTGVADRIYFGGTATSGQREYLMGGGLGDGSNAGACCLACWAGLSLADWYILAHD